MPHYHFHARIAGEIILDEEGQELPNIEAAASEAILLARELVCQRVQQGLPLDPGGEILIADKGKRGFTSVTFGVAMRATIGRPASS